MTIRLAVAEDLPQLIDIQARAGRLFAGIDMAAVAEGLLPTVAELTEPMREGRILVAADRQDTPIGFVLMVWVDGLGHVDQVSVDPAHGRQGIGRSLMAAADGWARSHDLSRLTLTTFVDVPWNGPFYRRLGWLVLADGELGPELAAIRAMEIDLGLDAWPRAAMAKDVLPQ